MRGGNDNNNDNSEIYINLYKPDAYGVIDDRIQAPQYYCVFDNLLDATNYTIKYDLNERIIPLYLRNDLELLKCIKDIYTDVGEENITQIRYTVLAVDSNFSIIQFGDTNYYCVGMDLGQIDPANPK